MKKWTAILLVLVTLAAALSGCGTKQAETTEPQVKDSLEILTNIWGKFTEDQKFAAMGGDSTNTVQNAPGAFTKEHFADLQYTLLIPQDKTAQVEDAATLVHMMNANTFTGGAVRLTEGTDQKAFVDALHEAIKGNQWMCGFPEQLVIATIGTRYVVVAFGAKDFIDPFSSGLTQVYADAGIAYSEALDI